MSHVIIAGVILIHIAFICYSVFIYKEHKYKRATKGVLGFITAAVIMVVSFCIAGLHTAQPNYQSYFSWGLFLLGELLAIGLFLRCLMKSSQ